MIAICWMTVLASLLAFVLVFLPEWVYFMVRDKTKIHMDNGQAAAIFLLLLFHIILNLVILVILITVDEKPLNFRKDAKILGTITLFLIVSQFNPYILLIKKGLGHVYRVCKYTLIVQTITLPFLLLACIIGTWILWRMSKVKPDYDGDEPYEVIYGGEGSSTKKDSDENSE